MTIDEIKGFFKKDKFAAMLGIAIDKADIGMCESSVNITPNLMNAVGIPHGGLIFTLCDFAGAVAANFGGEEAVTIDNSISYLNVATGNKITAVAKEISRTSRLSHLHIDVCDNNGVHVAFAKSTYYVIQKSKSKK